MNVGPGTYWLFPAEQVLERDDQCVRDRISAKRRDRPRRGSARTVTCTRPWAMRLRRRSARRLMLMVGNTGYEQQVLNLEFVPVRWCGCRPRRTRRFRRANTLVPPTNTLVPPTNTLIPPTNTTVPQTLSDTRAIAAVRLSSSESGRAVGGLGRARGNGARLPRELGEGGRGLSDVDGLRLQRLPDGCVFDDKWLGRRISLQGDGARALRWVARVRGQVRLRRRSWMRKLCSN